jgi:hypothetical protein
MYYVSVALVTFLTANAVVAFFIAFFWQAKVIFALFKVSDWRHAQVPWRALGDQNSPQNMFGRFIAGEVFPELRRKWARAVAYVVASYLALFAILGVLSLFAPEFLRWQ